MHTHSNATAWFLQLKFADAAWRGREVPSRFDGFNWFKWIDRLDLGAWPAVKDPWDWRPTALFTVFSSSSGLWSVSFSGPLSVEFTVRFLLPSTSLHFTPPQQRTFFNSIDLPLQAFCVLHRVCFSRTRLSFLHL